eukprot:m.94197 g.94197  ORF g.94197 m.94197 type:complete len:488 (+) comp13433_c0_seq1:409-1872(+)
MNYHPQRTASGRIKSGNITAKDVIEYMQTSQPLSVLPASPFKSRRRVRRDPREKSAAGKRNELELDDEDDSDDTDDDTDSNDESDEDGEDGDDEDSDEDEEGDPVADCIESLEHLGMPHIAIDKLTLGKEISSGSFGIVRYGEWWRGRNKIPVAVKTSTREDDLDEAAEYFETEAKMLWLTSRGTYPRMESEGSNIVKALGFSISWCTGEDGEYPEFHLIMERLECNGDVHDIISSDSNWVLLRRKGVDTGARFGQLQMELGPDLWSYTMLRSLKILISIGLSRALSQLRPHRILHCDIKPANTVLHKTRRGLVLKLIDFGEANTVSQAKGDVAGTPGYMAPEMERDGDASFASDIYSAGIYLLELWVGWIGPNFDDYSGASKDGPKAVKELREEIAMALRRLEKIEPRVVSILRKCLSQSPSVRPSARALVRFFSRLQDSSKVPGRVKRYKPKQKAGRRKSARPGSRPPSRAPRNPRCCSHSARRR